MQIFIKTLKGTQFKIEVNLEHTVGDVKNIIESSHGKTVYPADQQMLIYQGKVLKDEATLAEINVTEQTFIVIMLRKAKGSSSGVSTTSSVPASKPRTASSAPANPSIPAAAPAPANPSIPAAAPAPANPSIPEPAPAPATATAAPTPASTVVDAYGQAASNLVAGDSLGQTIQHILDIGGGSWDRISVVRALRAAFNNPERAIEYLYSGIPETVVEGPDVVPASPIGQQEATSPPVQAPQPVQPSVQSTGPNANPLNLFPQGLPNVGSNNIASLRNSPQFRALQEMVQANPQILQPMLREVGRQNPQIMRLVQDHQTEFLDWMNESSEGEASNFSGGLADAVPQSITVTPEEGEAIERLEAMGFEKALVLEVFFACNKNEEVAANYLLDHIHEFEEDDH